jgi:DNA invertase Pin-like site-specific DNA recombinase
MIGIYLRCSSKTQDTKSQEAELKAWADRQGEEFAYYRDKATGRNFDRPGWQRLWNDVQAGKVSRIVVWRLDRLGRTVVETLKLLEDLDQMKVGFISIRDGFDPSTPAGRLMRNILVSFAAYETEVRRERQAAGIEAAKAEGKKWGGRKQGDRLKVSEEKESLICRLKQEGNSVAHIANVVSLSRVHVYKVLTRNGLHKGKEKK